MEMLWRGLMRKTVGTGGDEGERGERRCLIIQQNQCSLFMALLDEPGGTVSTVDAGIGQPRKRRETEGKA